MGAIAYASCGREPREIGEKESELELDAETDWFEYVVRPELRYSISGQVFGSDAPKAGLLCVEFLDESGVALNSPVKGFSKSPRFGHFVYLASAPGGAPIFAQFMVPIGAARVRVGLRRWVATPSTVRSAFVLEETGSSIARQKREVDERIQRFRNYFLEDPSRPVVVISSTTKRLEEAHRANRPMMLARAMASQGVATLYVYYRFDENELLGQDLGPGLLQVPNDLFHELAPDVAAWPCRNPRMFLISIPDANSVRELGLFQHYGWRCVYEARDDWEEFRKAKQAPWYRHVFERLLCSQVAATVSVSCTLRDKCILLGADPATAHVVPNATTERFVRLAASSLERHSAPGYERTNKVGYFGHLTSAWFDWALLVTLAEWHPELQFELLGFGAPSDLSLPSNVHLLGAVAHEELVPIAADWDVGLIPFVNGKLARGVDPIKIYEYLALGLKCVACRMPQIAGYPLTFTYAEADDARVAFRRALSHQPTPNEWLAVRGFVQGSSWEKRARTMLDFLGGAR